MVKPTGKVTLDAVKQATATQLAAEAEGLENSTGAPLMDNPLFKAGLELLDPGSEVTANMDSVGQVRAVKAGLQEMVNQARERAEEA